MCATLVSQAGIIGSSRHRIIAAVGCPPNAGSGTGAAVGMAAATVGGAVGVAGAAAGADVGVRTVSVVLVP